MLIIVGYIMVKVKLVIYNFQQSILEHIRSKPEYQINTPIEATLNKTQAVELGSFDASHYKHATAYFMNCYPGNQKFIFFHQHLGN